MSGLNRDEQSFNGYCWETLSSTGESGPRYKAAFINFIASDNGIMWRGSKMKNVVSFSKTSKDNK